MNLRERGLGGCGAIVWVLLAYAFLGFLWLLAHLLAMFS